MLNTTELNDSNDMQNARTLLEVIPRAMRSIRAQMRDSAKSELTVPQFRVIARLSRIEATNADLAEWIGVTPPTMSKMVDILVKRNLVHREAGGSDRRQVRLTLTAQGRQKFDFLSASVQSTIAERLKHLAPSRKAALGSALAILQEVFL